MPNIELTSMCVLISEGKALMIDRIKSWHSWAFPGGHLEYGESMMQCAARELQEETGLCVEALRFKGVVNIFNTVTKERHIIFNYVAEGFTGTLVAGGEGHVAWIDLDKIPDLPLMGKDFERELQNLDLIYQGALAGDIGVLTGFLQKYIHLPFLSVGRLSCGGAYF